LHKTETLLKGRVRETALLGIQIAFEKVQERIRVMPIYEFDCLKCKNTFTLMLSLSEYEEKAKAGVRCPKCQSKKVEQLVSAQVQTSKKS
jgi:putative FmdB family regulatory protein